MNEKFQRNSKKNLFYIDVIKILSAILIILCHYDVHSFYRAGDKAVLVSRLYFFKVYTGAIGVSLFIIISGLTLALNNKEGVSAGEFYKKRFLAIFPSYWLSYIVVAIIFILIKKPFGANVEPWKFILTFLGIDGMFLHRTPVFYLVGEWYLGFILTMYLFFPFVFSKMKKNPIQVFIILCLINIIFHMTYKKFFL